jgi:YD repeat-containing protein
VQTWTYDNQLNVTAKTDALTHPTTFTYDANGNRLTETDATGTVAYTYNQFGEVLTRTDQMGGVTTTRTTPRETS